METSQASPLGDGRAHEPQFRLGLGGLDDINKGAGIQAGSPDQRTVNFGLPEKIPGVARVNRTTIQDAYTLSNIFPEQAG